MADFLETKVFRIDEDTHSETTTFFLDDNEGGIKGIRYHVPLPLRDSMGRGDKIIFYHGAIIGGNDPEIRHEDYVSANFYRQEELILSISGERLALFERAIQADKERVATDAVNEREVIG